ncbi:MAG: hypothetical protein J6M55_04705 [Paludibacteraceae bacterium]|nr:hypothetical protein [Paludibacteraceae bacterium]
MKRGFAKLSTVDSEVPMSGRTEGASADEDRRLAQHRRQRTARSAGQSKKGVVIRARSAEATETDGRRR